MTTSNTQVELACSDLGREALDIIFGPPGRGAIAAIEGRSTPGEHYNKPVRSPTFFPNTNAGREALLNWADDNAMAGINSFLNSAVWSRAELRREPEPLGEKSYTPLEFRCLWADVDNPAGVNPQLLRKLKRKGFVVNLSGGEDKKRNLKFHIRLSLVSEIKDVNEFHRLNRWLAAALGADAKWNAYNWLTVLGSWRFKADEYPDGRYVEITETQGGSWTVAELEELFAQYTPEPKTTRVQADTRLIVAEDVPKLFLLPTSVRYAFRKDSGDTSEDLWQLWKECYKAGLTMGQAVGLTGQHRGADKYDDANLSRQVHKAYSQAKMEEAPSDPDSFWNARPELSHIRDFARSRMVSPWAMFGAVLARAAVSIPTDITLPPLIGGHATLNLAIALVGKSGVGKGAADKAASEAFDFGVDIHTANVGTGEGIVKQYAYRDSGLIVGIRDSVLFMVDEVDTLRALKERGGTTLMAEIRKAWVGERLGFSNSDAMRTIPLMPHRYRFALIVGVQPENSATLLDDQAGGTPQRFLWLPGIDPDAPDETPHAPQPIVWERVQVPEVTEELLLDVPRKPADLHPLTVPDEAKTLVIETHRAKLRGEDRHELDSHALLSRLKVAGVLMWLSKRRDCISSEDWELAGLVMEVSDHTRAEMQRELYRIRNQAGVIQAKLKGEHAAISESAKDDRAMKTLAKAIVSKLEDASGRLTQNQLKKAGLNRRLVNEYFDAAVEYLTNDGLIEATPLKQGGVRYELM